MLAGFFTEQDSPKREFTRHYVIRTTVTSSSGVTTTSDRTIVVGPPTSRRLISMDGVLQQPGERELHPGSSRDSRLFKLAEISGVLGQ